MNELRRRIDALRRNLALELAIVKLYRLAIDFIMKWNIAIANREPAPDPFTFPPLVGKTGIPLNSHMAAVKYLQKCRDERTEPEANKLLYRLLPCARDFPLHAIPESPRRLGRMDRDAL